MRAKVVISKAPNYTSVDVPGIIRRVSARYAPDILGMLRIGWPVDTGKSRAGWAVQPTTSGIRITNPVDYVPYVMSKTGAEGAQAYATQVMLHFQPLISAAVQREIAAAMNRSTR